MSKEHKFPCFKSGVMNMGPCKASEGLPAGAPIALSSPHFYQVDQPPDSTTNPFHSIHLLTRLILPSGRL